jgi:hypothetical protein
MDGERQKQRPLFVHRTRLLRSLRATRTRSLFIPDLFFVSSTSIRYLYLQGARKIVGWLPFWIGCLIIRHFWRAPWHG